MKVSGRVLPWALVAWAAAVAAQEGSRQVEPKVMTATGEADLTIKNFDTMKTGDVGKSASASRGSASSSSSRSSSSSHSLSDSQAGSGSDGSSASGSGGSSASSRSSSSSSSSRASAGSSGSGSRSTTTPSPTKVVPTTPGPTTGPVDGSGSGTAVDNGGSQDDWDDWSEAWTDLEGYIPFNPLAKYFFNITKGLVVTDHVGDCANRLYCMHVRFHSQYGAESDFDGLVMDRYESKMNLSSDSWKVGEAAPLILGHPFDPSLSSKALPPPSADDWEKLMQKRLTTWTIYPSDNSTYLVDAFFSLKQLHTLLPDFNGLYPKNNGPFYSEDFNDQVMIRVTADLESAFTAASAHLPITLNTTGASLYEIEYSSSISFGDGPLDGGHEVVLDVYVNRKRYGVNMPWRAYELNDECQRCQDQMVNSRAFAQCVGNSVPDSKINELLYPYSNSSSFDMEDIVRKCFGHLFAGNRIAGPGKSGSGTGGGKGGGSRGGGVHGGGSATEGSGSDGSVSSDSRSGSGGSGDASSSGQRSGSGDQHAGSDSRRSSGSGDSRAGSTDHRAGSGDIRAGSSDQRAGSGEHQTSGARRLNADGTVASGSTSRLSSMLSSSSSSRASSRGTSSSSSRASSSSSSSARAPSSSGSTDSNGSRGSSRDSSRGSRGSSDASDASGSRGSRSSQGSDAGSDGSESSTSSSGDGDSSNWWADYDLLREADAAMRCYIDSQCPVNADSIGGRMIVFDSEDATARVSFGSADYHFLMGMEIFDQPFTTQLFQASDSEAEMEAILQRSIPNSTIYNLDIEVHKYDNLDEIDRINRMNKLIMEAYEKALQLIDDGSYDSGSGSEWSGSGSGRRPGSSSGSLGSRGGSRGDRGGGSDTSSRFSSQGSDSRGGFASRGGSTSRGGSAGSGLSDEELASTSGSSASRFSKEPRLSAQSRVLTEEQALDSHSGSSPGGSSRGDSSRTTSRGGSASQGGSRLASSSGSTSDSTSASGSSASGSSSLSGSRGISGGGGAGGGGTGGTAGHHHGHHGGRPGRHYPPPPKLLPVPDPLFTVEFVFENISIVPQVTSVMSSDRNNWTFRDLSLDMKAVPTLIDRFSYVPPPPGLNLDPPPPSAIDPSIFMLDGGACSECTRQFEHCLNNEHCAFGVRTYVWDAVQPLRFLTNPPSRVGVSDVFQLDFSDLMRKSRMFFPADGYEIFTSFMACIADKLSLCELDYTSYVEVPSTGQTIVKPATYLHFYPTVVQLKVARSEAIITRQSGISYIYANTNISYEFEDFLQHLVLKNRANLTVRVEAKPDSSNTNMLYTIAFEDYLHDPPTFESTDKNAEITYYPWRLEMETVAAYPGAPTPQMKWDRLLTWLTMFNPIPPVVDWGNKTTVANGSNDGGSDSGWSGSGGSGSFGSGSDGSGEDGSGSDGSGSYGSGSGEASSSRSRPKAIPVRFGKKTDDPSRHTGVDPNAPNVLPISQTVPVHAGSVCIECAQTLFVCLRNSDCMIGAIHSFIPSLDPKALLPGLTVDKSMTYHLNISSLVGQWEEDMPAGAFNKLTDVLSCVTAHRCPVSYNQHGPEMPAIPTYLTFNGGTTSLIVVPETTLLIRYGGEDFAFELNDNPEELATFIEHSVLRDLVQVKVSRKDVGDGVRSTYQIMYLKTLPALPIIETNLPSQQSSVGTTAFLASAEPAVPSWKSLVEWFGGDGVSVSHANGTLMDFVCEPCYMKVEACFKHDECSTGIREYVLPRLQRPATLNSFSVTDNNKTRYSVDITDVLKNMEADPTINRDGVAWSLIADALVCLSQRPCDMEYMTDAALPPATAHIPTFLHVQQATIELTLNMDTQVDFLFNDVRSTFYESGTTADDLIVFIQNNVLQDTSAKLSISIDRTPTNQYHYVVTIDKYVGEMPQVFIMNTGGGSADAPSAKVSHWRVLFESINSPPSWDKLTSWFALVSSVGGPAAPVPGAPTMDCSDCSRAWKACNDDLMCQFALAMSGSSLAGSSQAPQFVNGDHYEIDYTVPLQYQLLPNAGGTESRLRLMNVLKCLAGTSCLASSAGDKSQAPTKVVLEEATVDFKMPLDANMVIWFHGTSFNYKEDGNAAAFEQFISDVVLADMKATVDIQYSIVNGMMEYHFTFKDFYDPMPPHFSWLGSPQDDSDKEESVDKSWRFYLSAPGTPMSTAPLLNWLATGDN